MIKAPFPQVRQQEYSRKWLETFSPFDRRAGEVRVWRRKRICENPQFKAFSPHSREAELNAGLSWKESNFHLPNAKALGVPERPSHVCSPRANDICEFTPARAAITIAQSRHTDSKSGSDAGLFDWCKQLL
jgi:hypothetical protein